ncbi:MAG: type 2 isopentenyl-diphosphate Delta-isomerase [Candidatus Thermoplasmatota archaeon]|nr:type 2 isopentenyl-diphosphate Delta-isomerase [Candidatus Thermoplasmatota archaeon]
MNQTESRKDEHVRISIEEDVSANHNYWDDVILKHNALPDINKGEINLTTKLFNKKLKAPIIISGMTGGYIKAKKINENLAIAAEEYQIGMGVGSQRAALEKPELKETYGIIKEFDIPLRFANIGASQIVLWGHKKTLENAKKMIDMIDANVFIVCLNFLQEAVMSEGESNAKGCYEGIKKLADELDTPLVIKESGAGISFEVAKMLSKTKISGIDVGGAGGTSFSAIEHYRSKLKYDNLHERGAKTFWNWGIPTPVSILEVGDATNWKLPIISTGGIRNGLDAAKSLALGANCAGVARTFLKPATKSQNSILFEVETLIKELRTAMFLVGADGVSKMKDIGAELWI